MSDPVTDLSQKAVSFARMFDRLPPGDYVITLTKPVEKAAVVTVEIVTTVPVQVLKLERAG